MCSFYVEWELSVAWETKLCFFVYNDIVMYSYGSGVFFPSKTATLYELLTSRKVPSLWSLLFSVLAPRRKAHLSSPLTSLCSLCCLIDSSSLRLSSLRAFVSSASSSAMRALRVTECSRLWASSLLVLSSSSWSSDTRLLSSWASIEPLGSLCKGDAQHWWYVWHILT